VILLKRLLLLHAAQSGGDSGAPGNFFVSQVEEIFDGHFRRDSARFQGPLETHAVHFFVTRV
jgi:hypothetical protein